MIILLGYALYIYITTTVFVCNHTNDMKINIFLRLVWSSVKLQENIFDHAEIIAWKGMNHSNDCTKRIQIHFLFFVLLRLMVIRIKTCKVKGVNPRTPNKSITTILTLFFPKSMSSNTSWFFFKLCFVDWLRADYYSCIVIWFENIGKNHFWPIHRTQIEN